MCSKIYIECVVNMQYYNYYFYESIHFSLCSFWRTWNILRGRSIKHLCNWVSYVSPNLWLYGWGVARTVNILAAWIMVLVAVQRYLAICCVSFAKRWANIKSIRFWVCIVCLFAVIYDLPFFLESEISHNEETNRFEKRTRNWAKTEAYTIGYAVVSYGITLIFIPLPILCFTTYHLVRIVKQARETRLRVMRHSERLKSREDITLSLVVVVIVYTICQLPVPLRYFILLFTHKSHFCSLFWIFENISVTMAMLNSAANFLVYCLCAKRFRQKVLRNLKCRRENKVFPIEKSHAPKLRISTITKN